MVASLQLFFVDALRARAAEHETAPSESRWGPFFVRRNAGGYSWKRGSRLAMNSSMASRSFSLSSSNFTP